MSYPKSKLKKNVLAVVRNLLAPSFVSGTYSDQDHRRQRRQRQQRTSGTSNGRRNRKVFPLFLRCVLERRGAQLLLLLLPE